LIEAEEALHAEREEVAVLEERSRIAADMHDSATQSIYAALLFSQTSRRLFEQHDYEGADYYSGRVSQVVRQALKETRLLIFQLRPEALEDEGLVSALQHRLDMVETRSGVEAILNVSDLPPRSDVVNAYLYRIALEALNNAMKHAQADEVKVTLSSDDDRITLEVADNGIGFDPVNARDAGGLGLANMRARADELGATLAVNSEPGGGTTIRTGIKAHLDEPTN
jgi:signal transduction histidine kinase